MLEAGKSFVAGGLYAAGVVVVGGLIAAAVTHSVLPTFVDVLAPERMPRYTAHEIARAERFNPEQWSFPQSAQRDDLTAPRVVADADGSGRVQLARAD